MMKKNVELRPENMTVPPQNPWHVPDLENVRKILKKSWGIDTACPSEDPAAAKVASRGQCYVTALLIQKLFGGELIRGKVNGRAHFWNRIGRKEFDLTSDQYGGDGFAPVTSGKPVRHVPKGSNPRFKRLAARFNQIKERLGLPLFAEPVFYKNGETKRLEITDGARTVLIWTEHSVAPLPFQTRPKHESFTVSLEKAATPVEYLRFTDEQLAEILAKPKMHFNLLADLQDRQQFLSPRGLRQTILLIFSDTWAAERLIEELKTHEEKVRNWMKFELAFKTNTARKIPQGYIVRTGFDRFCLVGPDGKVHRLRFGSYMQQAELIYKHVKCQETIPPYRLLKFAGDRRSCGIIATAIGSFAPSLATVLAP